MRGDASECFVRYAANYLKVERCAAKARRLGKRELRSRAAADHLASPDDLKARLKVTCFARYLPQTRRSSSDEYGFSPLCKAALQHLFSEEAERNIRTPCISYHW